MKPIMAIVNQINLIRHSEQCLLCNEPEYSEGLCFVHYSEDMADVEDDDSVGIAEEQRAEYNAYHTDNVEPREPNPVVLREDDPCDSMEDNTPEEVQTMNKNQRIEALIETVSSQDVRIATYKDHTDDLKEEIGNLHTQVDAQGETIAELHTELDNRNVQVIDLMKRVECLGKSVEIQTAAVASANAVKTPVSAGEKFVIIRGAKGYEHEEFIGTKRDADERAKALAAKFKIGFGVKAV